MANWRKTNTPGVFVAHQMQCPASEHESVRAVVARAPLESAGRQDGMAGAGYEDRSEVLSWLAAARNAAHLKEQAAAGRTFESIGDEWLAGVEAGTIEAKRANSPAAQT